MPELAIASDYAQLAFHALAHLPIRGPGRLDPRYPAWCRRAMPEAARAPIEEDAPAIAELVARERCDVVHAMPELFRDLAQVRACAARELAELDDRDVASPALLRALRNSAAAELLRAAILLAAPAFERFFAAELVPLCERGRALLEPQLDRARALHPPLAGARVELAWPLGAHGRAFPERIVVGVPGDFAGLDAATPAVLAMHEASVRAHGGGAAGEPYVRAEWSAIIDVARSMAAAPSELREAHARWLAALDLAPLCERAAALGLAPAALAGRVAREPGARARLLASR